MVVKIASFFALLFAYCSTAAAQDIGGRYQSDGIDPKGMHFTLNAEIEVLPQNTCRIKWSDGSAGICILKDKILAVSYLIHGKLGLFLYEVSSDGNIEGDFIDDFHGGGIGKEKLIPVR